MTASKDLPPAKETMWRGLIQSSWLSKPQRLPESTDLSEKVAIVTGASAGIGFESSRQLLSHELSHLIMAVRPGKKGEAAAAELRSQYPKATVEVWPLEMTSYESIQAFAKRAQTQLTRLDIAILNAGIAKLKFNLVPTTGHEEVVQVNHLSTALLALLLLPTLKEKKAPSGAPGHLMITTTRLALFDKFPQRDSNPLLSSFDDQKTFNPNTRYATSKLLGQLFVWKLVEQPGCVDGDDVVVNLVEPGFTRGTQLNRDVPGFVWPILASLQLLFGRSVGLAASTYLDAVISKGKESHGCYIADWKIKPFAGLLYTPAGDKVADRLWEETLEELKFANVRDLLASMGKH